MKILKNIGIIREFAGDLNNNYNTTITGSNELALENNKIHNKEIKYNIFNNYKMIILVVSIFLLVVLIFYIYKIECSDINTDYKIINAYVK